MFGKMLSFEYGELNLKTAQVSIHFENEVDKVWIQTAGMGTVKIASPAFESDRRLGAPSPTSHPHPHLQTLPDARRQQPQITHKLPSEQ